MCARTHNRTQPINKALNVWNVESGIKWLHIQACYYIKAVIFHCLAEKKHSIVNGKSDKVDRKTALMAVRIQ